MSSIKVRALNHAARHELLHTMVKDLWVVMPLEDEATIEFRRSECEGCSSRDDHVCTVCVCLIKEKTESLTNRTLRGDIEATHCPLGKWGPMDKLLSEHYKSK